MKKVLKISTFLIAAISVFVLLVPTAYAASYKQYKEISLSKAEFCVGETWKMLTNSSYSWYMDGIRLRTDSQYYYLEYKARYSGNSTWLPSVKSTDYGDYAGIYGKHMTNVSVKVYNKINKMYDERDYVVMYRAMSGDKWCSWVSNATPDAMRIIKEQFSLSGELDTVSTDAGDSTLGVINAIQIRVFERCSASAGSGLVLLNVPYINQLSAGLPSGCEAVSAAMALKYCSYSVSAEDFATEYMPTGNTGSDPFVNYVGDPHLADGGGWGCYAPVIKKGIDKVINSKKHICRDLTGASVSELCSTYVSRGVPVIVWATTYLQTDSCSYSYWKTSDGKSIKYNNKQHCMLLVGYDSECYYFNDPLTNVAGKSTMAYPRDLFEKSYSLMGKQAVAIDTAAASSLAVSSFPNKLFYLVGETPDMAGLKVSVLYPNGDKKQVTNYSLSALDTSKSGKKTVKITWSDDTGKILETSFEITVISPKPYVSELKAAFNGGKGIYEVTQSIEKSDMTVVAVWRTDSIKDGRELVSETREQVLNDEFEIGLCDISTAGTRNVEITYQGVKCEISVTSVSECMVGETFVQTEPDCLAEGLEITLCALCGKKYSRKVLPSLGHSFSDEFTVDTQPDYTSCGEKSRHCTRCDERCDVTPVDRIISDIKGDANGDGNVNLKDVLILRKTVATGDMSFMPEMYRANADYDGDGNINLKDILNTRKKVVFG